MKSQLHKHLLVVSCIAILNLVVIVSAEQALTWSWAADLPEELQTTQLPENRQAESVDKMFEDDRPTIRETIKALGKPDGFSRQVIYSMTHGTPPAGPGGTFRFLLEDGELHVWTIDLETIATAIRWQRDGTATLLYK